jgi:hypothetical protein
MEHLKKAIQLGVQKKLTLIQTEDLQWQQQ